MDERSKHLRRLVLRMLAGGRRGHVGSALSLVEILRVLYDDIVRVDPRQPRWPGRDRCLLSKGHGCMALYAVLYDKGFFPERELDRFCAHDGLLGGHPETKVPGVEICSGSLGHGLALGVGMALGARRTGQGWRTFVIVGDGECDEGAVWESALSAGNHRLDALTVLVDYNRQQSYGDTRDVQDLEPFDAKWRAFGFGVAEVDGHDVAALQARLRALPVEPGRPSAVICHTVKGKGLPQTERNLQWHHKSRVSPDEVQALLAALEAS